MSLSPRAIAVQGLGSAGLSLALLGLLQAPAASSTTGSNHRRPQIQWLPAHVPHLATPPRRRPRKKRESELLCLGA